MSINTTNLSLEDLQALPGELHELISTNYLGFASFVILVYDHMVTFDDEVKYIWHTSKTKPIIILFLLLPAVCRLRRHNGLRGGCNRIPDDANSRSVASLGLTILSDRVHAIYRGDRLVLPFMWTLFFIMLGVNVWLLTTTGRGCSMLFGKKGHIGTWVSATAWSPLIFDTAVIVLVISRTYSIVRGKISDQSKVVTVLMRDGILYFGVILTINLLLAVMIVKAPDGIKNICAHHRFQLMSEYNSEILDHRLGLFANNNTP
ncbi:hypothetical protein BU17DRAFT_65966 [Hysterangium stoloniferum]|nr:hypothetical protein BU17DRAFT_65966 [Hysterangium stoloniferum]